MSRRSWRVRMLVIVVVCGVIFVALPPFGHGASVTARVGPGPPARPAAPTAPDPSLTAHPLAYAPGPVDNPLKGLAVYYSAGTPENTGYPHSLEWSYIGLSEVMTDPTNCSSYNWSVLDNMLNEVATYGNQAAIRFYLEFPGGTGTHPADAIPPCFNGNVDYRTNAYWGTTSPDDDSPFLLNAFDKFIAAFGARYDGDPRIGFVQVGLVGLWGEWNTWPEDGTNGSSDLMPTAADGARIINDYANAFHRTEVEIRYPTSGGGAANSLDMGYDDDSFCYREGNPLAGVTLPESMGGATYAQLQLALNQGTENKWITDSMGGEVRPEIQSSAFSYWPGGSGSTDNMQACIEMEHPTWLLDQASQGYSPSDPDVAAAVRLMGYDLSVNNAFYTPDASGLATVDVQISNDGVAPFYYPWTVTLGLQDSAGNVVKSWDTPWDLRTVMPLKIRAFPDWNVGSDPTYRQFGYPQNFQTSVDVSSVPPGTYQWVMRVDNPLASVSANAKTFRFANVTQQDNGWLGLGSVDVVTGATAAPPNPPTGLTASNATSTSVGLTWTPPSPSTGVVGYQIFRNGTSIATSTTPSYTDTGLTPGTSYTYSVEALDGTGTASALSATTTVATVTAAGGGADSGSGGGQTAITTSSYEAEAALNTLSGGAAVAACSGCSGGAKVGYIGNGGSLAINGIGGTGNAVLTIYYATAVSRSATVAGDGIPADNVNFAPTGGWNTVGSTSLTVPLGTGASHTLTFSNPTGWAPDIDRVSLSAPGAESTGGSPGGGSGSGSTGNSGTASQSYEAEAAVNTLSGGAAVAACPGCSGGAKVGYVGNGGTLTFNGVAGSGPEVITIYYATAVERSAGMSLDGNTPTLIDFPSSGGWYTDSSVSVTVDLQGNDTLEFSNPSGWAPDIDRIVVAAP